MCCRHKAAERRISWHLKQIGSSGRKPQGNENIKDGIGCMAITAGTCRSGKHSILMGIK